LQAQYINRYLSGKVVKILQKESEMKLKVQRLIFVVILAA
jgi:hypothetical protein